MDHWGAWHDGRIMHELDWEPIKGKKELAGASGFAAASLSLDRQNPESDRPPRPQLLHSLLASPATPWQSISHSGKSPSSSFYEPSLHVYCIVTSGNGLKQGLSSPKHISVHTRMPHVYIRGVLSCSPSGENFRHEKIRILQRETMSVYLLTRKHSPYPVLCVTTGALGRTKHD